MLKLRIIYIVSLVILGGLVALTLFRPLVSEDKYSSVSRESIIQGDDQGIIQFNIINREGEDQNYIISISVNGYSYRQEVLIRNGATFTYIHHIYPEMVKETGKVSLSVYKEGEASPFEQATYYICFKSAR
jgi:hypothetical protein